MPSINSEGDVPPAHGLSPEAERLIDRFERTIPEVAARAAERARNTIPGYAHIADNDATSLAENARRTFELLVQTLHGAEVKPTDQAYLRSVMARQTRTEMPVSDYLHAWRVGLHTAWDAIAASAEDDAERLAAFTLTTPVMTFINESSTLVAETYADVARGLPGITTGSRQRAVDALLAGRRPASGGPQAAACAAGLDGQASMVVVCLRPSAPVTGTGLATASGLLNRILGERTAPLTARRDGHVEAITPARYADTAQLARALRDVQRRAAESGVRLLIGASTIVDTLAEVPQARAEAADALLSATDADPACLLFERRPMDHLLRMADETTQRLISPAVRRFVAEDRAADGVLTGTLLAYTDADLNAKRAAEQLYVHPNTAYARLSRITAHTGSDLRRLRDLDDLRIAIAATGQP